MTADKAAAARTRLTCTAHEHELAAVIVVHNQVLCIAALFGLGPRAGGFPRIWLDATATLAERDAGERG